MDDFEQFSRALSAMAEAGAYSAKDIRQIGTKEVECEETVLWANNVPYAVIRTPAVQVPVYEQQMEHPHIDSNTVPLNAWSQSTVTTYDPESQRWNTFDVFDSIETVTRLLVNDVITGQEARQWCLNTNHSWSDIERQMRRMALGREDVANTAFELPKKKKTWPYRLVEFLNKAIDMFVQAVTEDFL